MSGAAAGLPHHWRVYSDDIWAPACSSVTMPQCHFLWHMRVQPIYMHQAYRYGADRYDVLRRMVNQCTNARGMPLHRLCEVCQSYGGCFAKLVQSFEILRAKTTFHPAAISICKSIWHICFSKITLELGNLMALLAYDLQTYY